MTRQEKIKVLNPIKEGKISIEELQPPRVYLFTQISEHPGIYKMDGREYTEGEYLEFCENMEFRNRQSFIWKEKKTYFDEDHLITFVIPPGCEPIA